MTGPARFCPSVCLRVATGFAVVVVVLAAAAPAHASGLIVPDGVPADGRIELASVEARAHVNGPIAEVTVVHAFRMRTKGPLVGTFLFPLPPGRVSEAPTLHFQKRVLEGRLLRGKAAREAWNGALATLRDASLIRHVGMDLYRAKLPALAPGARFELTITYEQKLPADAGLSSFLCPVRPTPHFEVNLELRTPAPLGPIYSPTHDVEIERTSAQHARVHYKGATTLETPCLGLYWSTTRSRIGATLLTYWPEDEDEGYYLVLQ